MKAPAPLVWVRDLIRTIVRHAGWLGPLLVRVLLGVSFAMTGWGKLQNLEETTKNFVEWGVPAAHFNAVLASCTEFLGGALLALGLLTRFAAVPLTIVMIVATKVAKWPNHESLLDIFDWSEPLYGATFLWFALAGAGKASLDYLIGKKLDLLVDPKGEEDRTR